MYQLTREINLAQGVFEKACMSQSRVQQQGQTIDSVSHRTSYELVAAMRTTTTTKSMRSSKKMKLKIKKKLCYAWLTNQGPTKHYLSSKTPIFLCWTLAQHATALGMECNIDRNRE